MSSSDLDVEFIGNSLELILSFSEVWKMDVDRGSHGGTEVGWAGGNVTIVRIPTELSYFLEFLKSKKESLENLSDV